MQKNFRITVDGRSYNVVVEDLDVSTAPAFARPAPPPVMSVAPPVAVAAPVSVAAPAAAPTPTPGPAGAGSIVAPLGGVVFSIDVPLGHAVAVGDRVAIIEAMKMKTEVMSKLAGTVSHIAAKANESVETGQILMTLG
jgi:glutaconyl-CoA/methylmalonyl-CoA decarboxylase subunit gamma